MQVRNRVREIRLRKGVTIYGMAKALGMSRQTIYDIEGDPAYNPTVHLMARIAEYLDVTVADLFEPERVA